jgi:phosphotransferase system enzyme I (PtsI)
MIEVPAAAMMTRALAMECDFFSIGTNDLAQYAMAADRNNPVVAQLASPIAPGLLQMLALISEGARIRGIPTSVCGDMAADPLALPLLLALGFRSLSMSPSEIPLARAICARLDRESLASLEQEAMACVTTREVEAAIVHAVGDALGDLWHEHGLVL